MNTCIVERGETTISTNHPLVIAGGVLPVDVCRLDWNSWQSTAETEYGQLVRRLEMFPDRPLATKLHGVLKLTADCLNPDTTGKATLETVWQGMLANRLDVIPEYELLRGFATLCARGPKISWVLADFEPRSIIWGWEEPTDPTAKPAFLDALERRNELLTRIFTTGRTRKYIGDAVSDVPWEREGILRCFNWMTNPNFDRHQCALMKWVNTLYMKALKDLLGLAGLYVGTKIIMAFQGRWPPEVKDNIWSRPQTQLFPGFYSNLQMYEQGMTQITKKFLASKGVRWAPTWSGDVTPEELEVLLNVCTNDTAVLFCELPELSERLAPIVKQWLSHKE